MNGLEKINAGIFPLKQFCGHSIKELKNIDLNYVQKNSIILLLIFFIESIKKCQWEHLKSDIEAGGYYYIIDDFCNVPKIKKALERVVKQSKTNKKSLKNENVNKSENKPE